MARGGKRQGTPGKGYANRTDLATNRAPQTGTSTAAAGGFANPPSASAAAPPEQSFMHPEDVPKLDDPSARPNEPITAGMDRGAGPGAEALGWIPPSPEVQTLQAAYMVNPTPQLRRVIGMLRAKGQL